MLILFLRVVVDLDGLGGGNSLLHNRDADITASNVKRSLGCIFQLIAIGQVSLDFLSSERSFVSAYGDFLFQGLYLVGEVIVNQANILGSRLVLRKDSNVAVAVKDCELSGSILQLVVIGQVCSNFLNGQSGLVSSNRDFLTASGNTVFEIIVSDFNVLGCRGLALENSIESQSTTLCILAQVIPAIVGMELQGNSGVTQRYPTSQFLAFGNNAVIFKSIAQSPSAIFLLERIRSNRLTINIVVDSHYCVICKRCKRHAHDNHEHSSQQSQQTSFKVRFLHVNFSYSLKFI